MKKILIALSLAGSAMLLGGCVSTTAMPHSYQDNHLIVRDGISLPDCETLPDASQADNGSRCWYR